MRNNNTQVLCNTSSLESTSLANPRNAVKLVNEMTPAMSISESVVAKETSPVVAATSAVTTPVVPEEASIVSTVSNPSVTSQVASKGLVFEFSVFWVITAYKEIAIGLIRNTFYTFRPVIMFFVMGYVVKFAFFLMGAPMLISFYSVWLFEVGYGLAQCVLSVIFLTQLAYMDMSFRGRLRPVMNLMKKRCGDAIKNLKNKIM